MHTAASSPLLVKLTALPHSVAGISAPRAVFLRSSACCYSTWTIPLLIQPCEIPLIVTVAAEAWSSRLHRTDSGNILDSMRAFLCTCLRVFGRVRLLSRMWPSKLWFLLKYWTCSLFEKEREREEGILFRGLLVWHLEPGEIPGRRRREGNVSNRREIKRGEKEPILLPTEWSGLQREIYWFVINEKMEKRLSFSPFPFSLSVA